MELKHVCMYMKYTATRSCKMCNGAKFRFQIQAYSVYSHNTVCYELLKGTTCQCGGNDVLVGVGICVVFPYAMSSIYYAPKRLT
jgi:hypothetical protein